MIRQHRDIYTINCIQGLKGFDCNAYAQMPEGPACGYASGFRLICFNIPSDIS